MGRIDAVQACEELRNGRRIGNRSWPTGHSVTSADWIGVTPQTMRDLIEPSAAEDWYVVPSSPYPSQATAALSGRTR